MNEAQAGVADLDGWTVRQVGFDPERLNHQGTVFTTGNGNFCVRGNFEEGHPAENSASFLHRVWDDMPVSVTELANLPRWWGIDLWLDGDRVRLDRGLVTGFERTLDLRTGLLTRRFGWRADAASPPIEVVFERFVNFADAHQAAVRVSVSLAAGEADLRVRAGVSAHVENTGLLHWNLVDQDSTPEGADLLVETRATGIRVATSVRVEVAATETTTCDADGAPAVEHSRRLVAGEPLRLTTFVAIVPDLDHPDPVPAARASASRMAAAGWASALADNANAWSEVWDDADIVIDGDPEAQLAVRFNLFQLLVAAPRFTDDASVGAKALSGYGYRHHVFWDTETFILPPFTLIDPAIARTMLMYRWRRLPGARAKAAANGYLGAQFPWESAGTGEEVTPTWVPDWVEPGRLARIWTGDLEIHITADIAYAVVQYWLCTGDDAFLRDHGAELVLDGASFWGSAARLEEDGRYHYRNVVGPDEYHEQIDDNAYTNHLASWHLRTAARILGWLRENAPDRAAELTAALGIDPAREAHWNDVAAKVYLALDPETGLIEQFDGFFDLTDVDQEVARDPGRTLSLQQILGGEGTNRSQAVKQPDVLMLLYLLPDLFTGDEVRANYAYYDPRTDHELGSSLGPSISAVMACRAGDRETAYQHFLRAARADLLDVRGNASDGIHAASAGGLWQAVVFGFAGLRFDDRRWWLEPRLPASWQRLSFAFHHRGTRHQVTLTND